ncbi:MAG: DUF1028 domain-containing protein [Bacteroidota bacterium]
MLRSLFFFLFFLLGSITISWCQNVPSLLADRDINATFAILAYDPHDQMWGAAVATNNLAVGNSTIYIEPGVGAFVIIAETEPAYAHQGFSLLQNGASIQEAVEATRKADDDRHYRQVAALDAKGLGYAFTGEALKYWPGQSGHYLGDYFIVLGNQLADSVLVEMARAFTEHQGLLAEGLLKALVAGQKAGGQYNGKQSAALYVEGVDRTWYETVDLRVDHSETPFADLEQLWLYYQGRIHLNQTFYAINFGNAERAHERLDLAEKELSGWVGLYPKLAQARILLDQTDAGIAWLLRGLQEEEQFKAYLPAFFYLQEHPQLREFIDSSTFSSSDWYLAVHGLIRVGRTREALEKAEVLLQEDPSLGYLYFLAARACLDLDKEAQAKDYLERGLVIDPELTEAKILLEEIKNN